MYVGDDIKIFTVTVVYKCKFKQIWLTSHEAFIPGDKKVS